MSIEGIKAGIGGIGSLQQPGLQPSTGVKETGGESSFGKMLSSAIKEVNSMQLEADNKIDQMIVGKTVSTHDAMIALEKADVAFQLMNTIRSKIVRAYEEVMRTQV